MPHSAMIAETDQPTADMMTNLLTRRGFNVTRVGLGEEVLDGAVKDNPDLVILDTYLPDTLGTTICHYLKSSPLTKTIPVIMTTFKAYNIERKIIAVAEGFLRKPISPAEFEAEVERLAPVE